jgi:hypothetical protein
MHVNSVSIQKDDGYHVYTKSGEWLGGPFQTAEEADAMSQYLSDTMGEAPVSEYRSMAGSEQGELGRLGPEYGSVGVPREGILSPMPGDSRMQFEPSPSFQRETDFIMDSAAPQPQSESFLDKAKGWVGGLLGDARAESGMGGVEQLPPLSKQAMSATAPTPTTAPTEEMTGLLDVPEQSETEKMYDAIFQSEHRTATHRSDPWIRTTASETPRGSSAFGPLQMTKGFMVTESKNINPTKEEQDYIDRFIEQGTKFLKYGNEPGLKGYHKRYDYGGKGDLTSAEDKAMYKQVALKILDYYMQKHKDPETVASKWRFGPDSNQKISQDDDAYWQEFKRVMGL